MASAGRASPYPPRGPFTDRTTPARTRLWRIFATKGAEKRRQHGSKGAQVFRDPNDETRVWVVFDWDAAGWQNFASDPEVPPIMQEAGHKGRPQVAERGGSFDA